jgi:hypothetical protein
MSSGVLFQAGAHVTHHAEECILNLCVTMYQAQLEQVMRHHRGIRSIHIPPSRQCNSVALIRAFHQRERRRTDDDMSLDE